MRILDRYIVRELFPPFTLGVGGFIVILIGDILYVLAEYIVAGRVTPQVMLRVLIYKVPAIMVITFPVSTLFGTLLGLGRLAKDLELQAMRLMGMSLSRLFAPVLAFGIVVTGLTFLTNEVIAPWANQRANSLIRQAVLGEAFPQVREQVFLRAPGNRFLYVEKVDPKSGLLHNVMVYETERPFPRLITAREASWSAQAWALRDGVVREMEPNGFTRFEASFAAMEIHVGLTPDTFLAGQRTPEEMTLRELRTQTEQFRASLSPRAAIEYHRKVAIPAASLIFALVAAPLSFQAARGGRFMGVGMSILLLFIYYVVMSVARAIGASGALSPLLAAWAPNLLFLIGGCVLVAKEEGLLRLLAASALPMRAARAGS